MEADAEAKKAMDKMEKYVRKHAAIIYFDKPRERH
jgi:hypothetical protein